MISVSALDWLRTGRFGPVRLGWSRDQVRDLLGPPEDVGGTSRKYHRPSIWKYGDIEFHFGHRDEPLSLLYLDHFGVPLGGRAIAFDPWILRGGLRRAVAERELAAVGLPFRLAPHPDEDCTPLVVGAGVGLLFIDRMRPFSPPIGLFGISHSVRRWWNRTHRRRTGARRGAEILRCARDGGWSRSG